MTKKYIIKTHAHIAKGIGSKVNRHGVVAPIQGNSVDVSSSTVIARSINTHQSTIRKLATR